MQALIAVLKVLRIGMAIAAFLGAGAFYDLAPLTQRCFPISAYYLLDGCVHWARALASESWPVVSGEVLSSGVEWTISYAGKFYFPKLSYRYDVKGHALENDAVETTEAGYRSEAAARAVARKYPVGAKIKVRVDPDDVMTTVLQPGTDSARRRMIIGLTTLAAPVVVGALLSSIGQ